MLPQIQLQFLPILYGLLSAITWGAGDFSGGMATKRAAVFNVVLFSQSAGGIFLLGAAILLQEALPSLEILVLGAVAGVAGTLGIAALYTALARGRMGVVAPLAALVAALLPVCVGILQEGVPDVLSLLGFGLALLAVWFLAQGGGSGRLHWQELGLPVLAGMGFGLFFVLIDRVSLDSILWPLAGARGASVTGMLGFALLRRWRQPDQQRQTLEKGALLLIVLAGILDAGGNVFFALATRAGRLDISTIVASLYPAGTVLLAWLILKERLRQSQWIGVSAALAALVLITL